MDRRCICVCLLLASLVAAAGCQQSQRREAAVVEPPAVLPTSTTVTLSAEQLMALDWDGRTPGRPSILDKRVVGAGVELDIRFRGNSERASSIDYISSATAGQGLLAGIDVGQYEGFALKFTVVSISGASDPNRPRELAVGPLVGPAGDGMLFACEPVVLGLASQRTTGVAKTPMHTRRIRMIGIHARAANPQAWDPDGAVVTLRVEPVSDAETLASSMREPGRRSRTRAPNARGRQDPDDAASVPTFGTKRIGAW